MAPILTATIGVARQKVDDERLRSLKESLENLKSNGPQKSSISMSEELTVPLDIEKLVSLLEPWTSWPFEEQVSAILIPARFPDTKLIGLHRHLFKSCDFD
jgi:hypothetical protein